MGNTWVVDSEEELSLLAAKLAQSWRGQKKVIFLEGDLGAGKTTFMRYYLRQLEYAGRVVSPTYTLVEQYEIPSGLIVHADLYRIHADEVYWLDLESLMQRQGVQFWIEWASIAKAHLMVPDHIIHLRQGENENSRIVELQDGY